MISKQISLIIYEFHAQTKAVQHIVSHRSAIFRAKLQSKMADKLVAFSQNISRIKVDKIL